MPAWQRLGWFFGEGRDWGKYLPVSTTTLDYRMPPPPTSQGGVAHDARKGAYEENTMATLMKLPVIATVRETYVFVWQERKSFWSLAFPAIAILAIMTAVWSSMLWWKIGLPSSFEEYMNIFFMAWKADVSVWFYVTWLVLMVTYWAVLVIYSVAWHRRYLVPEEGLSVGAAYRWRMRQTKFFLNYVKIFLLLIPLMILTIILLGIIGGLPFLIVINLLGVEGESHIGVAIGIAINGSLWIIVGWFFARLSMVFPATAIDNHMSIGKGWRFSRKNGWRIFWIIAFVSIPVWIVTWSLYIVIFVLGFESGLYGSLTGTVLLGLVSQVLAFIGIAIGVSALSISYKRLVAEHNDRENNGSGLYETSPNVKDVGLPEKPSQTVTGSGSEARATLLVDAKDHSNEEPQARGEEEMSQSNDKPDWSE